ncbi:MULTISPECIES: MurR/RpiR family transcriptional regulator [unclassified Salipiger]|uniref:MurR/RpiR family transcriptional regulator n=1 Tax=unclassified Salipiger TaxID=2640570 RepID=UPI0013BAC326|nr:MULTISPECIES: MurR/RpiR family transcriptional regulator [unclassified Salipiger]NDV53772.1 MurR/RpiR family transcriptional regulator [Salipiger sp. PrR003]NDW35707.1 MurR/RpiR family transcriptional regulator [Salipiger sp. PrR007]
MDIFATLMQEGLKLSQSEQRIADLVLKDIDFATNASITDLAARAEVSPPTVTRFCRRLGCNSFSDFKVTLAKSSYVGLRYLRPEAKSSTPSEVAEDIVTKAQKALFMMHDALDMAAMERAAETLSRAEMIYAFGSGGNSSMIVNEMQNRLFRLGARITTSTDHGMQMMQASAVTQRDVVFGSSFSGRNAELVRAFGLARDQGATTIALTQSGSPVSEAADVVLSVVLPEGENIFRPTSTRYAMLAVVDILANLVAYTNRTESAATLRRIKESLIRHRDGDDRQLLGD